MDWSKGFEASYYITIVDRQTWRDVSRLNITGGSITRSMTGLRQSADVTCIDYDQEEERYVRIWFDAVQAGETEHVPIFTGLATSPKKQIDGVLVKNPVQCYSVLKPAEDVFLPRGWYAPAGVSCEPTLRDLLAVTYAPVSFGDNVPALQEYIVAENGENHLTMVDKILLSIGWQMKINGSGEISIVPQNTDPVARFDPMENDSIEPQLSVERDWYSCPNVFRATMNDLSAVAVDNREDSMLSTVNRGREVWKEDSSCTLNAGETIAEYAVRRLKEEQQVGVTIQYDRRYNPDVYPADIVNLHYPKQEIDGLYIVTKQSITLGYGCRTAETVMRYEQV